MSVRAYTPCSTHSKQAYCAEGGRQWIAILTGGSDARLELWSALGPVSTKSVSEGGNAEVCETTHVEEQPTC